MAATGRKAPARKTNWFAIWISVAVVVVLVVVGGVVVWLNAAASGPGQIPEASNINSETGAIAIGEASDTMDTYIDFMCPVCNQFEQTYGAQIESLVNDGSITLSIHPISILDRLSQGTKYSTRAASAMYCVAIADPANAMAFMQAMYTNQPAENSTGLTDEQIIGIAESVGVTTASDCISAERYAKYVTSITPNTPTAPGSTGIGTPTVAINGTVIANQSLPADPADLMTLFQ